MLIKRCSTLYVIRELQIRTDIWYHHIFIIMAKIQTLTTQNTSEDVKQQELSYSLLVVVQNGAVDPLEDSLAFLNYFNMTKYTLMIQCSD